MTLRMSRVFAARREGPNMAIKGVHLEVGTRQRRRGLVSGEMLVLSVNAAAASRCTRCGARCPGYHGGDGVRRWRTLDVGTAECLVPAGLEYIDTAGNELMSQETTTGSSPAFTRIRNTDKDIGTRPIGFLWAARTLDIRFRYPHSGVGDGKPGAESDKILVNATCANLSIHAGLLCGDIMPKNIAETIEPTDHDLKIILDPAAHS
jgi:hypothetical protein